MSTLHLVRREDRLAPAIATPRVRWLTSDVILVLVVASTWGFAFSTFYLLPAFLVRELAAGPAEIGFVIGISGVATVLFTVVAAAWIDALPRRHTMALGALAMGIAALGFTRVHAIGWAIEVLRVLQGISYALVVTSVGTLIAELVPHERLSQALGFSGASMLIMNALAPAVAEPLAETFGWRVVFLLAAVAAFSSAALATRIHEPATAGGTAATTSDAGHLTAPRATRRRRGGLLVLLRRPLARQYALILALSGAAFGTVFTFQQPYALALGRARVGGFFVAYAAAAILVRVGFGHLPDRLGRHRVARAALLLYAGVVLGMAGMRPGMLEVLGAIFGLAHGVFYPAINALVLIASAPHERGRIVAIFTASFSLGLWAGPTVLGVVAAHFGYPAAFVVAAIGTLAAAGILQRSPEMRAAGALSPAAPAARRPDAQARRDAS